MSLAAVNGAQRVILFLGISHRNFPYLVAMNHENGIEIITNGDCIAKPHSQTRTDPISEVVKFILWPTLALSLRFGSNYPSLAHKYDRAKPSGRR